MGVYTTVIAPACIALILFFQQCRTWIQRRSVEAKASASGCGDVPVMPNKLPGGIERYLVRFSLKLDKLDFSEDVARRPFTRMGRYTYRSNTLFSNPTIYTAEPANVQALLSTQTSDFEYGSFREDSLKEVIGHGIFTTEGPSWKRFRRQLKPHFSRENVSNLEDLKHHFHTLGKVFPDIHDESGWLSTATDVVPLFSRFATDTSTELLFGESANSQTRAMIGSSVQDESEFSSALDYVLSYIIWRARMDFLGWLLPSGKFRRSIGTIHNYVSRYVDSALNKEPLTRSKDKTVLLEELIAQTQSPTELRDQILQLFIGGRTPTAALLSHAMLFLARNPQQYAEARAKVLGFFRSDDELTFDSIRECKLLTYILYETMRLLPPTALSLPRCAKRDTTLPCGGGPDETQPILVRRGEFVRFSHYTMYRRPDIWGSDAEEFRPMRWEGRSIGAEYIPFSMGPRICLGQQLALNEARYVLARMLMMFDRIEHVDAHLPIKTKFSLVTAVQNGVRLRMHRAADVEGFA
ncbi:unnamed protein product [Periconia digitata]|uniref:Cytochrome P450 n=1 Tax=Periconia digitata TaxID=1303443 RepID=A0A9W4UPW1_9PLEO|nr:unnamed protein product [Periconia digitata]